MSKLGLSLKISVPKSKTIPKPSIKIEAKDKRGYVILEGEEYKVLLANESYDIHNRKILPFTKRSYDLYLVKLKVNTDILDILELRIKLKFFLEIQINMFLLLQIG